MYSPEINGLSAGFVGFDQPKTSITPEEASKIIKQVQNIGGARFRDQNHALCNNSALMKQFIETTGGRFVNVASEELRKDKEFFRSVQTFLKSEDPLLDFPALKNDQELIKEFGNLRFASQILKRDIPFAKTMIGIDAENYRMLPKEVRHKTDVIKCAMAKALAIVDQMSLDPKSQSRESTESKKIISLLKGMPKVVRGEFGETVKEKKDKGAVAELSKEIAELKSKLSSLSLKVAPETFVIGSLTLELLSMQNK